MFAFANSTFPFFFSIRLLCPFPLLKALFAIVMTTVSYLESIILNEIQAARAFPFFFKGSRHLFHLRDDM